MGSKVQSMWSRSMNTDEMNMEYREDTSRWPPSSRQPRINRGTLRMITTVPMGTQGRKWLMIWPMPVMPPKPIWLGS